MILSSIHVHFLNSFNIFLLIKMHKRPSLFSFLSAIKTVTVFKLKSKWFFFSMYSLFKQDYLEINRLKQKLRDK